jgi:hypothetical protein
MPTTTAPTLIDDPLSEYFFDRNKPKLSDFKVDRMILYPNQWQRFVSPLSHKLDWKPLKFEKSNSMAVPDDFGGIYSFVVRPEIADHSQCAYLMYIGKTNKFRTRYYKYQSYLDKNAWDTDRPRIAEMIHKWTDYLWFYYAKVSDPKLIKVTETPLIQAFLPPYNTEIPGQIGTAVKAVF